MLLHSSLGPFEAIQAVIITQDILKQLMPFDFSIIADCVYQLHFFTEFSYTDDGSRDKLNFIKLKVKSEVEPHVPWLIPQNSHTYLLFNDLGCMVIEVQ